MGKGTGIFLVLTVLVLLAGLVQAGLFISHQSNPARNPAEPGRDSPGAHREAEALDCTHAGPQGRLWTGPRALALFCLVLIPLVILMQPLQESVSPAEGMTREILNGLPEPCLMLTHEAVVCCANDAARSIFNAKVGEKWQPEFDGAEEWFDGKVLERLLSGDKPDRVTFQATVRDSHYEVALSHLASNDTETAFIVTSRDITESVALREQLVQKDKLATVGMLAAGVAHEFNNILGGMLGYAGLARRDRAYLDKLLDVVQTQGARAAELTQGLLDFSRKPQNAKEYADVRTLADQVLALVERDMKKHGIDIRRDYQSVPKTLLNLGRIQQVLLNLFINARQSMENGGVLTIGTRKERDNVLITVSDTGCGIKRDDRHRVFEPFYTTKSAGEDGRGDGTGLGLSVSYNIVREHRGSIRVTGEVGSGSTFTVALPIVVGFSRVVPAAGRDPAESAAPARTTRRILVVDDEAVLRSLYREILTLAGHKVVCVGEGEKALELLAAEEFDLVFLDITLAGRMDGIETFEGIRQMTQEVKVVLSTGSLEHALIQPHIKRADAFLQKPFTMNDLLPLVDEL